ncbi:MAG: hypothetical protein NC098_04165 [Lachnoclostridium sp.]|nr:hypothetical protein [Lachnoclostridium sp.]
MSNVTTKILAGIVPALMLASCSGNSDNEKALSLYAEAEEAIETNDFNGALMLIDSINKAYPKAIDVRRKSMHLKARVNEGLALARLESADSLAAVLQAEIDSMSTGLELIKNPVENYYVAKGVNPSKFIGTDGIQARMSPEGDLYLMSSLGSHKVESTSITVGCNGEEATTAVVNYDGERNDRSMGAEVITFMGVECDSVARFIADHAGEKMQLTFNGKTSYRMNLPEQMAEDIATLTRYAMKVRALKSALVNKERQKKILDTARSQAARTYNEADEE